MAGLLARGSQSVRAFPAYEKPVAYRERTLRLQLRGQPRFWPLMGNPLFPFRPPSDIPGGTTIALTRFTGARRATTILTICQLSPSAALKSASGHAKYDMLYRQQQQEITDYAMRNCQSWEREKTALFADVGS